MFTEEMTNRLCELVKNDFNNLFPASRRHDALAVQNNAWEAVATTMQTEFPSNKVTLQQIKNKWKNLKQESKTAAVQQKRYLLNILFKISVCHDRWS